MIPEPDPRTVKWDPVAYQRAGERQRDVFYGLVRAAARPYRAEGWVVRTNGLRRVGPEGHWAYVEFWGHPVAQAANAPLFAGTLSPYLLRVWDGFDPTRLPSRRLGAHAQLVFQLDIEFGTEPAYAPPAFELVWPQDPRWVLLDRVSAPGWLDGAVGKLVPELTRLSSDLAIRDWLLDHRSDRPGSMRLAALLTRHLGLTSELPDVLARAEDAKAREDARLREQSLPVRDHDRGSHRGEWSHLRFLQFMDEAPV